MTESSNKKEEVLDFKLVKRAVPTIIVESQSQVLPYIHRAIKSRRMPSSNLKLFYLNSHPDLLVPDVHVKDVITDSGICLEKLSRCNWILPHVKSGLFDFVLWQHPIWSGQILDRQPTECFVGEDKETGRLCVNIPETYFYKEGIFCLEKNMKHARKFELMVAPIHETHTMCRVCENIIQKCINKPFIFIINLSSSTTQNPHKDRFNEEQFQLIDQLYAPLPPITISISPQELTSATVIEERGMAAADVMNAARRRQLNRIRYFLNEIENGHPITSPEVIALWPREISDLCKLVQSVRNTQPDLVKIRPKAVEALEQTLTLADKKLAEIGENLPAVALASSKKAVLKALTELGLQADDKTAVFPSDKDTSSCWPGTSLVFSVPDNTTKKALFPSIHDIRNPGCLDSLFRLWLDVAEDPVMPPMEDEDDLMVEVPKTEEELEEDECIKKYPPFIRSWHPHYVSTTEQQQRLCDDQESLMNRFHNPYLIFIVRNVDEGFTPADQVHDILMDQMLGLGRIYGPRILAVALDYKDSEKDAEEIKSMRLNVETLSEAIERIDNPPFPLRIRLPAGG